MLGALASRGTVGPRASSAWASAPPQRGLAGQRKSEGGSEPAQTPHPPRRERGNHIYLQSSVRHENEHSI